jgi:hypothetical protein
MNQENENYSFKNLIHEYILRFFYEFQLRIIRLLRFLQLLIPRELR